MTALGTMQPVTYPHLMIFPAAFPPLKGLELCSAICPIAGKAYPKEKSAI